MILSVYLFVCVVICKKSGGLNVGFDCGRKGGGYKFSVLLGW